METTGENNEGQLEAHVQLFRENTNRGSKS